MYKMQSTLNITKYFFETSKKTIKENKKSDNIYLIYQFFIHPNTKRNKEIQLALQINIKNTLIDKIYLLNEKIYTCDELGISQNDMKKIEQININKRILYKMFWEILFGLLFIAGSFLMYMLFFNLKL